MRDSASGEPISYANVFLANTALGAATNQDGYFVITNVPTGSYEINVSMMGYGLFKENITQLDGNPVRIEIFLTEKVIETEEILVTAERQKFQKTVESSQISLDLREIKAAPAFIEPDVFRTLQMLPGVQTSSDYSSALYVRGSTPDQNLIMQDGIAIYNEENECYEITGQKIWISNAGFAEVFIVFGKIDDDENITGFVLEKSKSNGITLGEEESKLGLHASSTRQVFYDKTVVPKNQMLGIRGNGFKIALNALNVGRIKLGAATGTAAIKVLNESIKYAIERKQFGKSISDFGAIQEKLATMATSIYTTFSGLYRAGYNIEQNTKRLESLGIEECEAKKDGVLEYSIECSIIKVHGSEVIRDVSDEAIQIFGGMGFSAESIVEPAYRDARISRIYEGTNEINRMLIVGTLLKRSMKKEINLLEKAMVVINSNKFESVSYDENNHFASAYNLISNLKNCLLYILGKSAMHFGNNIKTEQEVMMNIADMIISVYVMESTLKRCEKVYKNSNNKVLIDISKSSIYYNLSSFKYSSIESIISFMDDNECKNAEKLIETCTNFKHFNIKNINRRIADYFIEKKSYNIFNNF